MKFIIAFCIAVLLAACGSKTIEGTYVSQKNHVSITFQTDGTMFRTDGVGDKKMDGSPVTPVNTKLTPYAVDADKITVEGSDMYVLRLLPNGTINSAWGVLVKE